MSPAPPAIVPILATPLGIASIPESERLNSALSELFAQRMAADSRPQRSPLCFRSTDDLMEWPEQPVQQLAHDMIGAVYSVVGALNEFSEAQLRSFKLEARAWFTVVRANGSVSAASYPMTAWCAIYCVTAPAISEARADGEARADSGVVRLYESKLGTVFQDASNAAMRIPYSRSHYAWRPVAGKAIIFPACLTHEVALLRAEGELTLVTARMRFIGPGQQGFGRW
jgi:hypothetical protein